MCMKIMKVWEVCEVWSSLCSSRNSLDMRVVDVVNEVCRGSDVQMHRALYLYLSQKSSLGQSSLLVLFYSLQI